MKTGGWLRLASGALLLSVALWGIWFGYSCTKLRQDAERYEAIRMPVDLSAAGTTRGAFGERFRTEHGKVFRIEVAPLFVSHEEMLAALEGLKARIYFVRQGEDAAVGETIDFSTLRSGDVRGCAGYAEPPPHTPYVQVEYMESVLEWNERRKYELVLDVLEPAKGMMGRRQLLVSKNVYCMTAPGLMRLLGWAIIVAAAIVTAIGGALLWSGVRRLRA